MNKIRIIISGGGTGGHIFPALAIARAIEKKHKNVDFLFVGAKDRMEMQKIPAEGYKIIGLWISGLQRKFDLRNLLFPIKVLFSLYSAKKIIKDFKPHLAIGTGGYASAPLIYAASKLSIPTLIQEQNSFPGITNKILGKYVNKICVAYEKMERFFPLKKMIFTGNPIRKNILGFRELQKGDINLFNINKSKETVLILGGSLGAFSINNAIVKSLNTLKDSGVNIIWQTGISYFEKATNLIEKHNIKNIYVCSFIKEMDQAYALSDIIVSRAGAIAISELCYVGKPVILVPSPNVAENHQFKNAQSLVNKNAAVIVKDAESSRKLVRVMLDLIKNNDLRNSLTKNINKLSVSDAADKIASIALKLIK
jgi:UDP-N-acetylglucosamine--N-acetylmuramyl-(pentapeptide) pyrophosphoryl-undecaprenol N-acetylglucosamine transferase